jgi:hypothetical protein
MGEPIVGTKYQHYKGNEYLVIACAMHTETKEMMVIYQEMKDNHRFFARPLRMWNEQIAPGIPRFRLIQ